MREFDTFGRLSFLREVPYVRPRTTKFDERAQLLIYIVDIIYHIKQRTTNTLRRI